jgi:hypothetical protein
MYVWQNPMPLMYKYIFKSQCMMGNMPYAYLQGDSRIIYLSSSDSNPSFNIFLLNILVYPVFFLKHVLLLAICLYQHKYDTGFELLIFWLFGSFFFLTVFTNQVYYRKELTLTISAWLRFENYMKGK